MTERRKSYMEVDDIIERALLKGAPIIVKEALTNIGFDMSDPSSIQADIRHLRRSRQVCDNIKDNAVSVITKSAVTGIIGGGILYWIAG